MAHQLTAERDRRDSADGSQAGKRDLLRNRQPCVIVTLWGPKKPHAMF